MASKAFLAAMLVSICVAQASAQCIECSRCTPGNSWCLQNCKRQCEAGFNANRCQSDGMRAGMREGSDACKMLLTFCSQTPSRSAGRSFGGGWNTVNLQQCQNIFYGGCQSQGLNTARVSGCWFIGTSPSRTQPYKLCDANLVNDFFNGELNARCNKAANYYRP